MTSQPSYCCGPMRQTMKDHFIYGDNLGYTVVRFGYEYDADYDPPELKPSRQQEISITYCPFCGAKL